MGSPVLSQPQFDVPVKWGIAAWGPPAVPCWNIPEIPCTLRKRAVSRPRTTQICVPVSSTELIAMTKSRTDRLLLNSDRCALLPALFVGEMCESVQDDSPVPGWITRIVHQYGGHGFSGAYGTGILLPLAMTPLNGPLVDILRLFGEYFDEYFGVVPGIKGIDAYGDLDGLSLQCLLRKYPDLHPIRKELAELQGWFRANWDPLDDETRRRMEDLIGRFAKFPRIAGGKTAMIEFSENIDEIIEGWLHFERELFPCFQIVTLEKLVKLRAVLPKENVKSFLLWENSD